MELARGLLSGGYVLLAVGIGMGIGYWAADWEVRWLPAMARNILLLWLAAFAAIAWGTHVIAGRIASQALRRRTVVFTAFAMASAASIVLVLFASRTTPLSAMSEAEFRYAHELDARYFRDLDRSLRGLVASLDGRRDLFRAQPARTLTPEEERFVLDTWVGYLDAAMAIDAIREFHEDFYGFDLSRMERERHVRSFLLSFAAELSLFENTTRVIDILDGNENAVRFLNVERAENGIDRDSVARVREELSGLTDFSRVAAGKRYLDYLERVHQSGRGAAPERLDWLWGRVESYVSAVESRRRRDVVMVAAGSDFAPILRAMKHVSFPVQKGVAEWMGDVRVKRKGKYLISEEQARTLQGELAPGDVLLSRKNWYLSNIGLPGFWPHAILYVGTMEQMQSAFDEDPAVRAWVLERTGEQMSFTEYLAVSYPAAWRERSNSAAAGGAMPLTLIEAVSEGVIQNTLYGASGDFIVALRPRLSPEVKARAVFAAFSYLERPYDFDFDFATDHALVCTEVVWRSYRPENAETGRPGLRLEPIPVAGRLTLPANEIAKTFRDEHGSADAQFDFVYYLEGREAELAAVPAGVEAFLETPSRSKWDFGPL
jgi:hypothetical protein